MSSSGSHSKLGLQIRPWHCEIKSAIVTPCDASDCFRWNGKKAITLRFLEITPTSTSLRTIPTIWENSGAKKGLCKAGLVRLVCSHSRQSGGSMLRADVRHTRSMTLALCNGKQCQYRLSTGTKIFCAARADHAT